MKYKHLCTVLLVGFAAACQDAPSVLDVGAPSFATSDGAHGGNAHFYFLPPLVPSPDYDGEFNPYLKPTVVVSEWASGFVDTNPACVTGPIIRTFKDEVAVDATNQVYSVGWHTGDDLTTGKQYRICVRIGGETLGYRDIQPDENGADVPRNPEQNPIYEFNNGSTLPIKFRIEEGTLCSLDAIDCTETILGPDGGTAVCRDGFCGLQVPDSALNNEYTFVVQLLPCTYEYFVNENGGTDSTVSWLPTDLPQFGGCLEIHHEVDAGVPDFTKFNLEVVAGACVDAPNLDDDQFDRLQLHHLRESDHVVEALPNRAAGFLNCNSFITSGAPLSKKLMHYASQGLRKAQYAVGLGAPPLVAVDRGFGGGATTESPMAWALPAQMEKVNWTNPVIGTAGDVVDVTARVKDVAGDPVANARVWFEVTEGDGPPVAKVPAWTGSDGLAELPTWTLGPAGLNILLATGRGIGTTIAEGGTGVFATHYDSIVDLGVGTLTYRALVCDPSQTPNQVDGKINAGEYKSSDSLTVKVSGGSTWAKLYWTNDCESLYFGLEVGAAEEINNELLLVFDNDNDGQAEVGDDIWSLLRNSKTGAIAFTDRFLTQNCVGSKQASCGMDDVDDGGTNDLGGGIVGYDAGKSATVYEIRHPLTGDVGHDFQVDITTGDTLGVYLQLQLGKGAQGNTQYPGFRQYLPIVISPPSP